MSDDTPESASVSGDPKLSAQVSIENDPAPFSLDTDPSNRRMDRLLAYLGLFDDAAPLFCTANHIPHGGVVLALPKIRSASDSQVNRGRPRSAKTAGAGKEGAV